MKNDLLNASKARSDEWARVNAILPWHDAPPWARFAFRHCGVWLWLQKPPVSVLHDELVTEGEARIVTPVPPVLSPEVLFLRPGKRAEQSATVRLLKANAPVKLAGLAGRAADPDLEAVLIYGRILSALRDRFGPEVNEVLRAVLENEKEGN